MRSGTKLDGSSIEKKFKKQVHYSGTNTVPVAQGSVQRKKWKSRAEIGKKRQSKSFRCLTFAASRNKSRGGGRRQERVPIDSGAKKA